MVLEVDLIAEPVPPWITAWNQQTNLITDGGGITVDGINIESVPRIKLSPNILESKSFTIRWTMYDLSTSASEGITYIAVGQYLPYFNPNVLLVRRIPTQTAPILSLIRNHAIEDGLPETNLPQEMPTLPTVNQPITLHLVWNMYYQGEDRFHLYFVDNDGIEHLICKGNPSWTSVAFYSSAAFVGTSTFPSFGEKVDVGSLQLTSFKFVPQPQILDAVIIQAGDLFRVDPLNAFNRQTAPLDGYVTDGDFLEITFFVGIEISPYLVQAFLSNATKDLLVPFTFIEGDGILSKLRYRALVGTGVLTDQEPVFFRILHFGNELFRQDTKLWFDRTPPVDLTVQVCCNTPTAMRFKWIDLVDPLAVYKNNSNNESVRYTATMTLQELTSQVNLIAAPFSYVVDLVLDVDLRRANKILITSIEKATKTNLTTNAVQDYVGQVAIVTVLNANNYLEFSGLQPHTTHSATFTLTDPLGNTNDTIVVSPVNDNLLRTEDDIKPEIISTFTYQDVPDTTRQNKPKVQGTFSANDVGSPYDVYAILSINPGDETSTAFQNYIEAYGTKINRIAGQEEPPTNTPVNYSFDIQQTYDFQTQTNQPVDLIANRSYYLYMAVIDRPKDADGNAQPTDEGGPPISSNISVRSVGFDIEQVFTYSLESSESVPYTDPLGVLKQLIKNGVVYTMTITAKYFLYDQFFTSFQWNEEAPLTQNIAALYFTATVNSTTRKLTRTVGKTIQGNDLDEEGDVDVFFTYENVNYNSVTATTEPDLYRDSIFPILQDVSGNQPVIAVDEVNYSFTPVENHVIDTVDIIVNYTGDPTGLPLDQFTTTFTTSQLIQGQKQTKLVSGHSIHGFYNYHFVIKDKAGNTTRNPVAGVYTVFVTMDTEAPLIDAAFSRTISESGKLTVTATGFTEDDYSNYDLFVLVFSNTNRTLEIMENYAYTNLPSYINLNPGLDAGSFVRQLQPGTQNRIQSTVVTGLQINNSSIASPMYPGTTYYPYIYVRDYATNDRFLALNSFAVGINRNDITSTLRSTGWEKPELLVEQYFQNEGFALVFDITTTYNSLPSQLSLSLNRWGGQNTAFNAVNGSDNAHTLTSTTSTNNTDGQVKYRLQYLSYTDTSDRIESTFYVITTNPTTTITAVPNLTSTLSNNTATYNLTTSVNSVNKAKVFYRVDNAAYTDGGTYLTAGNGKTQPFSVAGFADGNHSFSIYALDYATNQGNVNSRQFIIDTTPPRFNTQPSFDYTSNSAPRTTAAISDQQSAATNYSLAQITATLRYSNVTRNIGTFSFGTSINPQNLTYSLAGLNFAGNMTIRLADYLNNTVDSNTFYVDVKPPAITWTTSAQSASSPFVINLAYAVTDDSVTSYSLKYVNTVLVSESGATTYNNKTYNDPRLSQISTLTQNFTLQYTIEATDFYRNTNSVPRTVNASLRAPNLGALNITPNTLETFNYNINIDIQGNGSRTVDYFLNRTPGTTTVIGNSTFSVTNGSRSLSTNNVAHGINLYTSSTGSGRLYATQHNLTNADSGTGNSQLTFDLILNTSTFAYQEVTSFALPNIDLFATHFRGYLQIDLAGTYRFGIASDDGSDMTLYINGVRTVVVNDYGLHGPTVVQSPNTFNLTKGWYPVELRVHEQTGGQQITPYWIRPASGALVPIPFEYFSTNTFANESRTFTFSCRDNTISTQYRTATRTVAFTTPHYPTIRLVQMFQRETDYSKIFVRLRIASSSGATIFYRITNNSGTALINNSSIANNSEREVSFNVSDNLITGNNIYKVSAWHNTAQTTYAQSTVYLIVDITAPSVTIVSFVQSTVNPLDLVITFTISDASRFRYVVQRDNATFFTESNLITNISNVPKTATLPKQSGLENTINTVGKVIATDEYNNVGQNTRNLTCTVSAPTITILEITQNGSAVFYRIRVTPQGSLSRTIQTTLLINSGVVANLSDSYGNASILYERTSSHNVTVGTPVQGLHRSKYNFSALTETEMTNMTVRNFDVVFNNSALLAQGVVTTTAVTNEFFIGWHFRTHLKIDTPGSYRFKVISDDGADMHIYVDGVTRTFAGSHYGVHPAAEDANTIPSNAITLGGGTYFMEMRIQNNRDGASINPYWLLPGTSVYQLIPAANFIYYPGGGANYPAEVRVADTVITSAVRTATDTVFLGDPEEPVIHYVQVASSNNNVVATFNASIRTGGSLRYSLIINNRSETLTFTSGSQQTYTKAASFFNITAGGFYAYRLRVFTTTTPVAEVSSTSEILYVEPLVLDGVNVENITTTTATLRARINQTGTIFYQVYITNPPGYSSVAAPAGSLLSIGISNMSPGVTYKVDVYGVSGSQTTAVQQRIFTTQAALTLINRSISNVGTTSFNVNGRLNKAGNILYSVRNTTTGRSFVSRTARANVTESYAVSGLTANTLYYIYMYGTSGAEQTIEYALQQRTNGAEPTPATFTNTGTFTYTPTASGTYTIRCYGAEGGSSRRGVGGKGGYAYLRYNLSAGTAYRVQVGAKAANTQGFINDGVQVEDNGTNRDAAGGGGGTSFGLGTAKWIVAGAGGGAGAGGSGSRIYGGGGNGGVQGTWNGSNANANEQDFAGFGGTTTAGGRGGGQFYSDNLQPTDARAVGANGSGNNGGAGGDSVSSGAGAGTAGGIGGGNGGKGGRGGGDFGGGGGGGGWFGGGGGSSNGNGHGESGGGGSSFYTENTGGTFVGLGSGGTGLQSGNGKVEIVFG